MTVSGCPKCGLADKNIRKVSAVVRAGTQVSGLAKDLMPPIKPQLSSDGIRNITFVIGVLTFFCGCAIVWSFIFVGQRATIPVTTKDLIQSVVLIIIGSVIVGLVYWSISRDKRKFQEKLLHWQHAMNKWDQLYYCEIDDILFNPDDEDVKAIPVSEMTRYIYS